MESAPADSDAQRTFCSVMCLSPARGPCLVAPGTEISVLCTRAHEMPRIGLSLNGGRLQAIKKRQEAGLSGVSHTDLMQVHTSHLYIGR